MKGCGEDMCVLLLILLAAVFTDYRYGKIPNWMILFGIISGLFISFMNEGILFCLEKVGAVFIPVLFLYPLFLIEGIGAGDIKLFSVVGSFLGIKGVFISLIFAFVVGAIISILKLIKVQIIKKDIFHRKSIIFPKNKIHFAIAVFLGVMIYIGGIF